jgi:hypothetical protein
MRSWEGRAYHRTRTSKGGAAVKPERTAPTYPPAYSVTFVAASIAAATAVSQSGSRSSR